MRSRGKNLKTKLATVSFLLTFLWAALVPAELKLFPLWEQKQCNGETFACYTFDQAKEILKVDLDLQFKLVEFSALEVKYTNLELAYSNLDQVVELLNGIVQRFETRMREKQEVLEETTVRLTKAERHHVMVYLPWIITGVVVLTGAGVGVGFYLGTR